jgi:pimeloyl-ACP methyl ester carboxylesterase
MATIMEEHILKTDFGDLYTAVSRPEKASKPNPSILLLHGNSIGSRIFERLIQSDSNIRQTHEIVVFDFPGHG